ncbi:MAG: hypothetical protein A7316_07325 [Candidatus Altiarchaeales archaeon WOR_SM1_86-2]|nr:MAG: hypothetical protein A7316_07325 [Candidatus Altiarchaeales archaeon WOR_SM1_86-2]ODS40069.1 MAG: hypothetical protein A7315_09705 [Candidatus Altiarchaeales archaeon WOR_SM1_79]
MPKIEINTEVCVGCGICVDICPVRIFDVGHYDKVYLAGDVDDCTLCRECEVNCPTAAITIMD